MPSKLQKHWCPFFILLLLNSTPLITSNAQEQQAPNNHVTVKLSDPSVKCDTCELPSLPPPLPECPPPPPPPCPPPPPPPCPPPPRPSCLVCWTMPETNPPPPPPELGYMMSGQGNVYVTEPYGTGMYSGQTRSAVSNLGLWALLMLIVVWR